MAVAQQVDLEGFKEVPFVDLPFTDFAGDTVHRWLRMNSVLSGVIEKYDQPKILDIATGGGQDSIYLLRQGYDVTSNEIDEGFLHRLRARATQAGLQPKLVAVDWRDFLTSPDLEDESFDVLFGLGNSFPNYLFEKAEREVALHGFWRVLKPGGTLFFDTRNYDYMLDNAEQILKDPEHNFEYGYGNTYTNRAISCFPTIISPELVRLTYKHYGNGNWAQLDLWPATHKAVTELIDENLPDAEVTVLYDYRAEKPEHFDFLQYLVTKPAA